MIDTYHLRCAGQDAGRAGKPSYSCPHKFNSPEYNAWAEGWVIGVEERERAEDEREGGS